MTHLSDSVTDLMENVLRPNPGDRLTLAEIKQHPWCVAGLEAMGRAEQAPTNDNGVAGNGRNEGVEDDAMMAE